MLHQFTFRCQYAKLKRHYRLVDFFPQFPNPKAENAARESGEGDGSYLPVTRASRAASCAASCPRRWWDCNMELNFPDGNET